jgi:hypothetical protein
VFIDATVREKCLNYVHFLQSSAEVQAISHCATSLYNKPLANNLKMSQDQVLALCRSSDHQQASSATQSRTQANNKAGAQQQQSSPILQCVRAASTTATSTQANKLVTTAMITSLCRNVSSEAPGKCLAEIATNSQPAFLSAQHFPHDIIKAVCSLTDHAIPRSHKQIITCLHSLKGAPQTRSLEDVSYCSNVVQTPTSVTVNRFLGEQNDIHAMAGKRFSVWLQVLDQFDQKITGGPVLSAQTYRSSNQNNDGWFMSVSINENNVQGAVLWGTRTNYTSTQTGLVQFNNLVITQPGTVEFKVWYYKHSEDSSIKNGDNKVALAVFYLKVLENPMQAHTELCTFVFRQASTPSFLDEEDYLSTFPRVVGQFPSIYYPRLFACSPILDLWNVSVRVGAQVPSSASIPSQLNWTDDAHSLPNQTTDGHHVPVIDRMFYVEYRQGMDSVWTGTDFPSIEMNFVQRLSLDTEVDACRHHQTDTDSVCFSLKQLKRAYYRKSLLWHPDRWSNMPVYAIPVQGAFELISEAYNGLQELLKSSSADDSDQDGSKPKKRGRNSEPEPPVYD